MSTKGQRATALIFASLFFLSTVAFTGVVIWEYTKNDKSANTANNEQETQEGPKLEGTKLQNYTPVDKVDSLQKVDLAEGSGPEVQPGATITAHYTGAIAKDGTIFESSHDRGEPATFPLSGVIAGWTQGVPGMKVGGKRRLIIPAAMAYGEQGSPPKIGPNEPLVFDIELTAIQ